MRNMMNKREDMDSKLDKYRRDDDQSKKRVNYFGKMGRQ
jgi:hypothetical protein